MHRCLVGMDMAFLRMEKDRIQLRAGSERHIAVLLFGGSHDGHNLLYYAEHREYIPSALSKNNYGSRDISGYIVGSESKDT